MSGENNGSGSRDAKGRFKKGSSGNPRGRPAEKRRLDVPEQLARDVMNLGREVITVAGPDGPRSITKHELVVDSIFRNAVKGKAASQKLWIDLTKLGLAEMVERHPALKLADAMRCISEDPEADLSPGLIQAVDYWKKRLKRA